MKNSKFLKLIYLTIFVMNMVSTDVFSQSCCITQWTPGMWIGPASSCGTPYGGTQVVYNGNIYRHRGYCSNTGPGTWDFQLVGPCTPAPALTSGAIGSAQTICSGTNAAQLTNVTSPTGGSGTYAYQWQVSSDGSSFGNISGATASTYSPGTLTADRWYRRVVSSCNQTQTSASIKITVSPARTISGPSSNPTVCVGTPIPNITRTTTNVTGIASTSGLPPGVSASYASNTITIGGTPTGTGTFNYTITPSGCGTATSTGTITVNPNKTVGAPSSNPTVCVGLPITNITRTTTNVTGIASSTGLPAGLTVSYASNTITISGTPTATGVFN